MNSAQQQEIFDLFKQYQDVVCPMIVALEIDDDEFPIEILNEIRAIMNHLAACTYWDEKGGVEVEAQIDKELNNAKSHLKRAVLDCYKYSCLSVEDYYTDFSNKMRRIDLSVIDNGEFCTQLSSRHNKAKEALRAAKLAEYDVLKHDTGEPFELFQAAYEKYNDVRRFISDSMVKVEKTRRKQIGQGTFSIAMAVIGFVLTAVGTILTIIGFH